MGKAPSEFPNCRKFEHCLLTLIILTSSLNNYPNKPFKLHFWDNFDICLLYNHKICYRLYTISYSNHHTIPEYLFCYSSTVYYQFVEINRNCKMTIAEETHESNFIRNVLDTVTLLGPSNMRDLRNYVIRTSMSFASLLKCVFTTLLYYYSVDIDETVLKNRWTSSPVRVRP